MKFRPLFDLSLTHTYNEDGHCPDFVIEPTTATTKLLRDHRCVLKSKTDGIRILLAVDARDEPFIPLPAGKIFSFRLHLQNRDFMFFTNLKDLPAEGIARYTNANLNDSDNRRLSLTSTPAQKPVDRFAEVEIHVNQSLPAIADGPGHFEIAFTAKQFHWEYYVVTNLRDKNGDYRIEDTEPSRSDAPIIFQKDTAVNVHNKVLNMLAAQYPDMKRMHFVSKQPIFYRRAARKNIRLLLNNNSLLENLPNPSLTNFARLTLKSGDDTEFHDSLFQIVKYITHPFATNGI